MSYQKIEADILKCLQPLKVDDAVAAFGIRVAVDLVDMMKPMVDEHPSKRRRTVSLKKFAASLRDCRKTFGALSQGTFRSLKFRAENSMAPKEPIKGSAKQFHRTAKALVIGERPADANFLRILDWLISVVEQTEAEDNILDEAWLKEWCVHNAFFVVSEVSKRHITKGPKSPDRIVARLLYKHARGIENDMKKWCDKVSVWRDGNRRFGTKYEAA